MYAYGNAYQENYPDSYDNGYQVGYNAQYPVGHDEGYQSGLEDGHKRGYDEAYEIGIVDGYSQGYDVEYAIAVTYRHQTGYDKGYESGIEDGRNDGISAKVNLHKPSYDEVVDFLRFDPTNRKPYIEDEYICTDFSADVSNNAEDKGIQCILVLIEYKGNQVGHAIISFNTTDRGTIFVEPQTDEIIDPAETYEVQSMEAISYITLPYLHTSIYPFRILVID
ncbi:hypothetical protein ACFLVO_02595 [Chloroflexota bacterium]